MMTRSWSKSSRNRGRAIRGRVAAHTTVIEQVGSAQVAALILAPAGTQSIATRATCRQRRSNSGVTQRAKQTTRTTELQSPRKSQSQAPHPDGSVAVLRSPVTSRSRMACQLFEAESILLGCHSILVRSFFLVDNDTEAGWQPGQVIAAGRGIGRVASWAGNSRIALAAARQRLCPRPVSVRLAHPTDVQAPCALRHGPKHSNI